MGRLELHRHLELHRLRNNHFTLSHLRPDTLHGDTVRAMARFNVSDAPTHRMLARFAALADVTSHTGTFTSFQMTHAGGCMEC